MSALHTQAAQELLRYVEHGAMPSHPETWPHRGLSPRLIIKGQSPNLFLRYLLLSIIWYLEHGLSYEAARMFGHLREFMDDCLANHIHKREDNSSQYLPAWSACIHVLWSLPWTPNDIKRQCEQWLDRTHSINALCWDAGYERWTNDALKATGRVNPPCQRVTKGKDGERRTYNTAIYLIERGELREQDYNWPKKWRTGSDGFVECVWHLSKQGKMYKPKASLQAVREARLAMPFRWRSSMSGGWAADAVRPYDRNPNNARIENTWGRLGEYGPPVYNGDVIGAESSIATTPTTWPPPIVPPPATPTDHVSVLRAALEMRIAQLREHPSNAALDRIADAMEGWTK